MIESKNESLHETLKLKQSAIVEKIKLDNSDYWLVKYLLPLVNRILLTGWLRI